MIIEPQGIVTIATGLLVLYYGPTFGIFVLAIATLLGAAAALKLPAFGGASIMPSHAILMFLAAAVAARPKWRSDALSSFAYPRPGFWLLAIGAYGALTAVFLPRIFADMTYVYSIARTADDEVGIVTSPLAPQSSNITQVVYLAGDLVCYAVICAQIANGRAATIARAILAAAAVNLVFAAADLITYATDSAEILSVIRNANYRMLEEGDISGLKRIVGSFPEASAYAYASLGLYAFAIQLWLRGVWTRCTGLLAVLLLITLILSTSTTGYISLAVYSLLLLVGSAVSILVGRGSRQMVTYTFVVPAVAVLLFLGAMLVPSVWTTLTDLFNETILGKLESQSGVERARWNEQALVAFIDTIGFGAGVGSVRASSLPIAILSNVGVTGLVLFAIFIGRVTIARPSPAARTIANHISDAGASACLVLVIAASISASSVDLGLAFFIFAGLAASAARTATPVPRLDDRLGALAGTRSLPWPAR